MKHEYVREGYDPSTKTLSLSITSDKTDPKHQTKAWEIDPQLQIIRILTDMKVILSKLLDHSAPYHTGPKVVEVDKGGLLDAPEEPELPDPES